MKIVDKLSTCLLFGCHRPDVDEDKGQDSLSLIMTYKGSLNRMSTVHFAAFPTTSGHFSV